MCLPKTTCVRLPSLRGSAQWTEVRKDWLPLIILGRGAGYACYKRKWHKSIKAGRYTSGRNRRYGCNYAPIYNWYRAACLPDGLDCQQRLCLANRKIPCRVSQQSRGSIKYEYMGIKKVRHGHKGDITGKACQKTKTDCRANKRELALSLSADVYADRERACSRLPMTRKPRRRLQRHGLRHNPSFL